MLGLMVFGRIGLFGVWYGGFVEMWVLDPLGGSVGVFWRLGLYEVRGHEIPQVFHSIYQNLESRYQIPHDRAQLVCNVSQSNTLHIFVNAENPSLRHRGRQSTVYTTQSYRSFTCSIRKIILK